MEILQANFNAFPSTYKFFNTKQQYVPVTGIALFSHIKYDFLLPLSNGTEAYFLEVSGKTKINREKRQYKKCRLSGKNRLFRVQARNVITEVHARF